MELSIESDQIYTTLFALTLYETLLEVEMSLAKYMQINELRNISWKLK